jgi:hypothetical protein
MLTTPVLDFVHAVTTITKEQSNEGNGADAHSHIGKTKLDDSSLEILFRVADQTHDRMLTFSEFALFALLLNRPNAGRQRHAALAVCSKSSGVKLLRWCVAHEIAFRIWDADNDGLITKSDFVKAMNTILSVTHKA